MDLHPANPSWPTQSWLYHVPIFVRILHGPMNSLQRVALTRAIAQVLGFLRYPFRRKEVLFITNVTVDIGTQSFLVCDCLHAHICALLHCRRSHTVSTRLYLASCHLFSDHIHNVIPCATLFYPNFLMTVIILQRPCLLTDSLFTWGQIWPIFTTLLPWLQITSGFSRSTWSILRQSQDDRIQPKTAVYILTSLLVCRTP